MEAEGVITANVAQVNPEAVGLPLTIIVVVELVSETPREIDAMRERFLAAPEVQQCHYVTGEADFILTVAVASMRAYEDFTRRVFLDGANVQKFRTFVSMGEVKAGTTLHF